MLNFIAEFFFGRCAHKRTTFPLTPSSRNGKVHPASPRGTYVVCLDCGKEFRYDWSEMQMTGPAISRPVHDGPIRIQEAID